MVIDRSSFSYLLAIFPGLTTYVVIGVAVASAVVILLWRLDPFRMRRLAAIAGAVACLLGLGGLSVTHPFWPEDIWYPYSHVSNFARSGVDAVVAYARRLYGIGCDGDGSSQDDSGRGLRAHRQAAAHHHGA